MSISEKLEVLSNFNSNGQLLLPLLYPLLEKETLQTVPPSFHGAIA